MKQTYYGEAAGSVLTKQWMMGRFGNAPTDKQAVETITLVEDGKILGAVWLENYNGTAVTMHVAGEAGGHWLTRSFMRDVFEYCFNYLGCKKLLGIVRSVNAEARRFDEHLGFRLEASIADADPEGDLLIYSLRREDCKYLRGNHG